MSHLSVLQLDSPVSYLLALVLPALDALVPLVPSESVIVALGVATAGSADPRIAALVALAAAGAFLGDNLSYLLGRRFGPAVERRFFTSDKGRHRRESAQHALEHYGVRLILVCRFVPGGRTAVTLVCGLIAYPRRTFLGATAVAAILWASYAFYIGRLGGKVFEHRPWAGFLVAFGAALAISGLIEIARRARAWRHARNQRRGT